MASFIRHFGDARLTTSLITVSVPLLIVIATRDPQGFAHLVEAIFTLGARPLNATATFLAALLGGHSH